MTLDTSTLAGPATPGPDAQEPSGGTRPSTGAVVARLTQRNGALVVLVLLCIVMAIVFPSFRSAGNLGQIAIQASFFAPIAIGMTFVIFTGGIDLSVGSVYALGGVLAAWGSQYGFAVGLLLPLVGCGVIGLVQGAIVARTAIPAFIVTLAGLLFARGLLLALTHEGATTFKVAPGSAFLGLSQGSFLGIGWPIWITALLVVAGIVVLHRTSYGSTLLAIGGQEDAAQLMGLAVGRSKLLVYTISGLLAGLAGALTASYTASGVTTLGVGLELTAISAVVLGGTLLTGGAGTVVGSLVGIVLLQVVANLINRLGLTNSNWEAVVNGVVLAVVAVGQVQLSRIQARARTKPADPDGARTVPEAPDRPQASPAHPDASDTGPDHPRS